MLSSAAEVLEQSYWGCFKSQWEERPDSLSGKGCVLLVGKRRETGGGGQEGLTDGFLPGKDRTRALGSDLKMTYDGLGDTKEDGEGIFFTRRRD